ncbi:hypothetical protein V2O64_23675 [Verrucomicrobiaceae bacterium 227]
MKNSPDKIERMKAVLAKSCPKPPGEDRQALPAAARQLLEKSSSNSSSGASLSWWQRLQGILQGPQLIGLGAAAVLLIMVALHFSNKPPTEIVNPKGQAMRSGGDEKLPALLVVLKNLNDQQAETIQSSGYFQEDQIVTLDAGDDLQKYRDHQVVLIDGASNKITTPFATTEFTQAMASDPDELVSQILAVLSTFPATEE